MNIVFFQFVPNYGGADRCTIEFAVQLQKHAKVSIVDPYGSCKAYCDAVKASGIDYYVLSHQENRRDIGGWNNSFSRIISLAKYYPEMHTLGKKAEELFEKIKPTVICTHNFKSGMVLALNNQLRRIPCCYYLHNWYRPPQMTKLGKLLLKKHAAGVIGVSYSTLQACICAGVPWEKLQAIYNPIDVEQIEKYAQRPLESPLPHSNNSIKILLPAAIRRVKGHKIAIESINILTQKGHDVVLLFPGESQNVGADRNYITELQREIDSLNLNNRIKFIGHRNDMPQVIKHSDILILPSIIEGHPRVILEGMALKKPFIGTPAGGSLDMLSPGLTGELIRFNNPSDLADAIELIILDKNRTKKMVNTAYEWVKSEFTPQSHANKLLDFLSTITQ